MTTLTLNLDRPLTPEVAECEPMKFDRAVVIVDSDSPGRIVIELDNGDVYVLDATELRTAIGMEARSAA